MHYGSVSIYSGIRQQRQAESILKKATNSVTGLGPDYSEFDGRARQKEHMLILDLMHGE